jgi:sodium-dependent dicarboxylate transporter 2/3/5
MNKRLALKLVIVSVALAIALWLCFSSTFIKPSHIPESMEEHAPQRCLAVFVVCLALWVTNIIPLAATGLLALALLPLLGIISMESSFEKFGNEAVFFMLGVFLLAAATIATGLSKRITLQALQRFDRSPGRLVVGVVVSAAFLSLWMPEHAVAAMIYPILVETVDSLKLRRGHNYAKKLFLGLAWGSTIGGVGTFLGGARAPLALSLLKQSQPDMSISFLSWMGAAIPVVAFMVFVAIFLLGRRIPDDLDDIRSATAMLDERVRRLGPMSGRERRMAALMVVTILAWITIGHVVGLAVIAVCSATMLFVLRIVDWQQAQGYVNWGVLVMYGGAVALGKALTETRAMEYLAGQVIDPQFPTILILAIMALASILLTEGISNSAAVAIMLPIGYSLGELTGVDPLSMTLAVTITAGLAFSLPISSPPNAISFSAGHYGLREVVQMGWRMNVIAYIVVLIVLAFWWPLLGHKVW